MIDCRRADIYESWIPCVGTRVVVRPSPECLVGHYAAEYDRRGVVAEVGWDASMGDIRLSGDPAVDAYRGHWYWVDFDVPYTHPTEHRPIRSELYAAIELEPVT